MLPIVVNALPYPKPMHTAVPLPDALHQLQREPLRRLVQASADAVLLFNTAGQFVAASASASRMLPPQPGNYTLEGLCDAWCSTPEAAHTAKLRWHKAEAASGAVHVVLSPSRSATVQCMGGTPHADWLLFVHQAYDNGLPQGPQIDLSGIETAAIALLNEDLALEGWNDIFALWATAHLQAPMVGMPLAYALVGATAKEWEARLQTALSGHPGTYCFAATLGNATHHVEVRLQPRTRPTDARRGVLVVARYLESPTDAAAKAFPMHFAAGVALASFDLAAGRYLHVNEAFEQQRGYTLEQLERMHPNDVAAIIHHDDRSQVQAFFHEWRAANYAETRFLRYRICNREGMPVQLNSHFFCVDGPNGRIMYQISTDVTDPKELKTQFALQRAYWQELFEHAPEAVVVLDLHGRVLDTNQEFSRMFGYSAEEALGQRLALLNTPADRMQEAEALCERTFAGGRVNLQAVRIHKNGTPVQVSILTAPIYAEGQVVAVYGIYRDISEQHAQTELLRKQTAQVEETQLLARICSFRWHMPTDALEWSPSAHTLFSGNDPAFELPQTFSACLPLMPPDDAAQLAGLVQRCVQESLPYKMDLSLALGRRQFSVVATGQPVHNAQGQVVQIVGTIQDVTERREAEERFEMLSLVARHTVNAVSILRPDMSLLWVNEGYTRLSGFSADELLNKPPHPNTVMGMPTTPELNTLIATAATQQRTLTLETEKRSKRGKRYWVQLNATPVFKMGKVHSWVIVENDITQLILVQERLQDANFELDSFVYKASHDLKAPLRSILGLLSVVEHEFKDKLLNFYLEMVRKSVDKLDASIVDLLTLSRANRVEAKMELVDIDGLTNEILESLSYLDNFNHIRIDLENEARPGTLLDRFMLSTILNNLLSNGIKYHNVNQEDPYLKISLKPAGANRLVLTVTDNGTGIDPAVRPRIFDMFFRGSEQSFGTGLGLYIVKSILKKQGGRITVQAGPNGGTMFVATLPVKHRKDKPALETMP